MIKFTVTVPEDLGSEKLITSKLACALFNATLLALVERGYPEERVRCSVDMDETCAS